MPRSGRKGLSLPNHYADIRKVGWMTLNVQYERYCPHCESQRLVILDGTNSGVPCPMCEMGMEIDTAVWWNAPEAYEGFWADHNVKQFTWNNGRGVRHYICQHCKKWQVGRPHDCPGEPQRVVIPAQRFSAMVEQFGEAVVV